MDVAQVAQSVDITPELEHEWRWINQPPHGSDEKARGFAAAGQAAA